MLNRKYFPFERNSYYFGKLLTAKDFEAEQRYFNDKRRFLNRLTGADGILSGLGVIRADDASVVIQAGCALDASGREIVAPETRVVKLSTIEGFAQLTSSCAYLGISYQETPADRVYAVMAQEGAGEDSYNRVREGYKLTLLDEALVARVPQPIDEFIDRQVIYSDGDIEVAQYLPRYLPLGSNINLRVELRKIGPGAEEYSFCYELAAPNFEDAEGNRSIQVGLDHVKLACGDCKVLNYTLTPEPHVWSGGGSVAVTITDFAVQRSGEVFNLNQNIELLIKPVNSGLEEFCLAHLYSKSMDKLLEESYDERLWIAKINLIRQDEQVIIDSVAPPPFGQYTYNAQQLMLLRRLEQYYPDSAAPRAYGAPAPAQPLESYQPEAQAAVRDTACGVFELGIGLGHDQKETIFSDEIMHGLGKGPVYVQVGVEYISSAGPGEEVSEILLGDVDLFADADGNARDERVYNLSTAVKVLPERGTFIVGLRLHETTGLISLRIRWYAFRLGEIDKQLKPAHGGERYILINPDTIVLPPKGTAHISPVFINMPTEACNFRLVDAEGGHIDQSGVYTAPAKEGVYEIRVEAISDPSIYTHAFAIVSQKKKEE